MSGRRRALRDRTRVVDDDWEPELLGGDGGEDAGAPEEEPGEDATGGDDGGAPAAEDDGGGEERYVPRGTRADAVLRVLRLRGDVPQADFPDVFGWSQPSVSLLLGRMEAAGLVERERVAGSTTKVVRLGPGAADADRAAPRREALDPPGPPPEEDGPVPMEDAPRPPSRTPAEGDVEGVRDALVYEGRGTTADVADAAGVRVSVAYGALCALAEEGRAVLVRAPGTSPSDVRACVWSHE